MIKLRPTSARVKVSSDVPTACACDIASACTWRLCTACCVAPERGRASSSSTCACAHEPVWPGERLRTDTLYACSHSSMTPCTPAAVTATFRRRGMKSSLWVVDACFDEIPIALHYAWNLSNKVNAQERMERNCKEQLQRAPEIVVGGVFEQVRAEQCSGEEGALR